MKFLKPSTVILSTGLCPKRSDPLYLAAHGEIHAGMSMHFWQGASSSIAGMGLTVAVLAVSAGPKTAVPSLGVPLGAAPLDTRVVSPLALPDECAGRKVVLDSEANGLLEELEAADLQLRIVEHRRIRREGMEQSWPDDPDPMQMPEVLRISMLEALDETGVGNLVGMDCEEYPCIVAIETGRPPSVEGGSDVSVFFPALVALNDKGYDEHDLLWFVSAGVHGTDTMIFAVTGPERPDKARTIFRGERYAEEIWSEMGDAGDGEP